uniref:Uncharacterized protein n=1 Tax=Plectus sambesii TaxID=2011161 RepID=A0A914UL19_9BILA
MTSPSSTPPMSNIAGTRRLPPLLSSDALVRERTAIERTSAASAASTQHPSVSRPPRSRVTEFTNRTGLQSAPHYPAPIDVSPTRRRASLLKRRRPDATKAGSA